LLQYRGELLPLKDEGNALRDLEAARQAGEEVQAAVLICGDPRRGRQRVGVVVRQVLDVSTGTLLDRDGASSGMGMGMGMELALVKEKVTLVQREFGARPATTWQEVA
jgi:two-component system, chemotaxis family, sensor kinase CheA